MWNAEGGVPYIEQHTHLSECLISDFSVYIIIKTEPASVMPAGFCHYLFILYFSSRASIFAWGSRILLMDTS